jgi:small GTP-binding protein
MNKTEIVLGSDRVRIPRRVLITCGLFENDPTLLSHPYEVRSPVSPSSLRAFLDRIQGYSIEFTSDIESDITLLCSEFQVEQLSFGERVNSESELKLRILALEEQMRNHDRRLSTQRTEGERLCAVEQSCARLLEHIGRCSSELEHLHREVERMKDSFTLTTQAMREEFSSSVTPVRPDAVSSVATPSAKQSSSSGGGFRSLFQRKPKANQRKSDDSPLPIDSSPKELLDGRELKIVLLGSADSGKTKLVKLICPENFMDAEATIGSCYFRVSLTVGGKQVSAQLWDTAGSERFQLFPPMYLRGASAVLIVYRTHKQGSFDSVQSWVELARRDCDDNPPVLIVALDVGKGRSVVSEGEGRSLAERLGVSFVEVSSDQSVITKGLQKFLEDVHV